MSMIVVKNLTRDYGNDKGVFDVSFSIEQGEHLGFLDLMELGKRLLFVTLWDFLNRKPVRVKLKIWIVGTKEIKYKKRLAMSPGKHHFLKI